MDGNYKKIIIIYLLKNHEGKKEIYLDSIILKKFMKLI